MGLYEYRASYASAQLQWNINKDTESQLSASNSSTLEIDSSWILIYSDSPKVPLDHDVNILVENSSGATITGSGGPLVKIDKQIDTNDHVSFKFINAGNISLDKHGVYTLGNDFVLTEFNLNNSGQIRVDGTVSTFDVSAIKNLISVIVEKFVLRAALGVKT